MTGCFSALIQLLLLPFCMGVFYLLFALRQPFPSFEFEAEGAAFVAGVAGFLLWSGIFYLKQLWGLKSTAARLRDSGPWRDGDRITVAGPVKAEGDLLSAPFTGRECLGYYYYTSRYTSRSAISDGGSNSGIEVREYDGFALTPTAIQTPRGRVKILAPSDQTFFEKLPTENVGGGSGNRQRAADYFATTDYGKLKGLKQAYHHKTSEGPGSIRYDTKPARDPENSFSLHEIILQPQTKVILNGVYSAAERGIGPDPNWTAYPFVLQPGDPSDLAAEIRSNRNKALVWIALSGLAAATYFLIILPQFS